MIFKKGFTLVEMLVVMAVLSIAGVFILNIFTRTLRGSNKSQLLGMIKQNGQSVLETMDKTIRNAENVVCASSDNKTIVVVNKGTYTRYRFIAPSPSSNPTVNGLIQQDNPAKQNVKDSSPEREETDSEFVNRVCVITDPMLSPATLTDTNSQTGVSVNCVAVGDPPAPNCAENPIFTRDRSSGFREQITIKFDVGAGVEAPQSVAGQIDPVSFQTTIQLR